MAELKFNGVSLRRADRSVWFGIAEGWIDSIPDVRGVDTVVPGRAGRTERNRKKDRRVIILNGRIQAATEEDMFDLLSEMAELWDPTLTAKNLIADEGYRGLAPGQTATILARTVNVAVTREFAYLSRYSWELHCIENPPEWEISEEESS